MSKSGATFFSAVIVPLLTVAVTVTLVFLWSKSDEKSTLFWLNLGYGVALELLFFGYIAVVRAGRPSFTMAFYAIMGVCAIYYIVGGVILMLLSSMMSLKLYITLLSVLTVVWLIAGALVAETDARHKADEELTKEKNRELMNRRK